MKEQQEVKGIFRKFTMQNDLTNQMKLCYTTVVRRGNGYNHENEVGTEYRSDTLRNRQWGLMWCEGKPL